MKASLIGLAIVACGWPCGCLPGDERPEPGKVTITVTGSQPTREGFTTADGWSVSFDRVLLSMGPPQLGDECTKYGEPGYDRVLDAVQAGAQKLGVMFAVGQCDFDFVISPPGEDALLGAGVSEADKTFLRTPGRDRHTLSRPDGPEAGITLRVEGGAAQASLALRFAWDFRLSYEYEECRVEVDGAPEPGLDLQSGDDDTLNLLVEAEALFRDHVNPGTATLRFDPIAAADVDADAAVTLEELAEVRLDDVRALGPYFGSAADVSVQSLEDYVYEVLVPTVVRYRDTGRCNLASTFVGKD